MGTNRTALRGAAGVMQFACRDSELEAERGPSRGELDTHRTTQVELDWQATLRFGRMLGVPPEANVNARAHTKLDVPRHGVRRYSSLRWAGMSNRWPSRIGLEELKSRRLVTEIGPCQSPELVVHRDRECDRPGMGIGSMKRWYDDKCTTGPLREPTAGQQPDRLGVMSQEVV